MVVFSVGRTVQSTRSGPSLSLLALPPPFSLPLENNCLPRETGAGQARALREPEKVELSRGAAREEPELDTVRSLSSSEKQSMCEER